MCVQKYVKSGENDENHNYVCTKIVDKLLNYVHTKIIFSELCTHKNTKRGCFSELCTHKNTYYMNYVCTKIVDNVRFSPKNRYFSLKMAFFRIMCVQKYVKMKKF